MNREFGDAGWWFDTSALKPDETAERLVAEVPDRTTPLAAGWHTWLRRLHDVEPESISVARRAPIVRADCSP